MHIYNVHVHVYVQVQNVAVPAEAGFELEFKLEQTLNAAY